MQELSQKLKKSLIETLVRNEQNIDDPYLFKNNKRWTRREIAKEIENETEFGIDMITSILNLSLDLMSRNNK